VIRRGAYPVALQLRPKNYCKFTTANLLQLDFYVYASWQVQLHQRIDSLVGWVNDIHQALVRTDFELIARSLVDVRRGNTSKRWIRVGSGTGPLTTAPVRLAVSTISCADWSISL
jgi:hypothetical protein